MLKYLFKCFTTSDHVKKVNHDFFRLAKGETSTRGIKFDGNDFDNLSLSCVWPVWELQMFYHPAVLSSFFVSSFFSWLRVAILVSSIV